MEQIFNIKRFKNYIVYQFTINRKSSLLVLSGFFVALLLFVFTMVASDNVQYDEEWMYTFYAASIVLALILVGHSFHALRNDRTTLNFLTLPASLVEKYVFEVVFKILLFIVIYPIVFWLVANLAVGIADFLYPKYGVHLKFTYKGLNNIKKDEVFPIIVWTYVFGISLAFAGSTAFKKLPLVKTLVFVGVVVTVIIGFMYLLLEEWHLDDGIEYVVRSVIKDFDIVITIMCIFFAVSAFIAMVYAFINIKEREL